MAHPIVEELNTRRTEASVSVRRLLSSAGVSYSTWWNWLNAGATPNVQTIDRLNQALDAITKA